jgi:hypothetical protein
VPSSRSSFPRRDAAPLIQEAGRHDGRLTPYLQRRARLGADLTQLELANRTTTDDAAGVSYHRVVAFEQGRLRYKAHEEQKILAALPVLAQAIADARARHEAQIEADARVQAARAK